MNDLHARQQTWLRLAASICEGVSLPGAWLPGDRNMAGRTPAFSPSGNLAFAAGLAATGLRASAWLGPDELPANANALRQAVRNLQPLVVIADLQQAKPLAETGAFMLHASSAQELLDFTVIAHHAAEQSLVPGVIIFNEEEDTEHLAIPTMAALHAFLGDADQRITSPTPAQQILFGQTRRRIPRMFHPDLPVLSGAAKADRGIAFEQAARQAFLAAHVDHFLQEAADAFYRAFGRQYRPFVARKAERAETLLVSDSTHVFELGLGAKGKSSIGHILLKQLLPFPASLVPICEKARAIATVEQSTGTGALVHSILLHAMAHKAVPVYRGLFAGYPAAEPVQEFIRRIESGSMHDPSAWLDIPFSTEHSDFPKKQVLMQDVQRGYPHLGNPIAAARKPASGPAVRMPERIPMALRRYQDRGPVYSRLAHFFDTTAFFYARGDSEWTADPFQAMPVIPPATAGFGQATAARTHLPVIDMAACTGCGECLVHCPHAAMPSLALDPESFIRSGIQQAQAKGMTIASLHPHVKALAKAAIRRIPSLRDTDGGLTLGRILLPALEDLVMSSKLEGEKLDAVSREVHAVIDIIGGFAITAPDTFFSDAAKDLFSIAIDPNACTGCGICADVCGEKAIRLEPENAGRKASSDQQFSLWEQFPDTSGDTLQRLLDDPQYPSLAALMLSRNFYMSLTGASDPSAASAKTMIHLVTAVAETMTQKGLAAMVNEIDERIEAVSANLKASLAGALPDVRDAGLAATLDEIQAARLSIDELLANRRSPGHGKLLDKAVLQRKIELIRQLADLKDLVLSGAGGTGRSRYGIALDSSLAELAAFPVNSFTVPVIHFDGSSVEMARGLVLGHLRHILDNLKVLRRAALEETDQYNPLLHDQAIASLQWADLSDAEKAFAPPLFLVARQHLLQQQGAGELSRLLEDGLPVKVIILDNANPPVNTGRADLLQDVASLVPFIALRDVQVMQGSLARPEHLFEGLISAIGKPVSAFIRLLAPDQAQGNMQLLHALASDSRAFLHIDYRPDRPDRLVLSKMRIEANPATEQDWVTRTIRYGGEGEEQEIDYELTFADWLYAQANRKAFFAPYAESMGEAVPVADYLRRARADRSGKVPVILRVNASRELVRHAVAEAVIAETESALHAWQLLRELAGELAEFPEKVLARATQEATEAFAREKNDLVAAHEQRIRQLEQEHLETIRARIKARLMALSGSN